MDVTKLDPELAAALQTDPRFTQPQAPPPEGVSLVSLVAHAREQTKVVIGSFAEFYAQRLPSEDHYFVGDENIPVEDGEITLRVVRPTSRDDDETYPVLVWFHGGGWVIGDLANMDDNYLRTVSVELQLAIVSVDYRLAPEHPFPTPFNDAYAAVKWVAENASRLKVSLDKGFLVGGGSSGANLAATIALQARDDPFFGAHGRTITGQYLIEPVIWHPLATVPEKYKLYMLAFEENKNVPFLDHELIYTYHQLYNAPPEDPRVNALLASSHVGLPPAFIRVNELDPLRDDGVVYEKVLREAGVPTKLVRNEGVGHGFYYSFPAIAVAAKVDRDAREGLKWLLSFTSAS